MSNEGEFKNRIAQMDARFNPYRRFMDVQEMLDEARKDFPMEDTQFFNKLQTAHATTSDPRKIARLEMKFQKLYRDLAWKRFQWFLNWFGEVKP